MAKLIGGDTIVFCDVDDTLVMWDDKYHFPEAGRTEFEDPYDNSIVYLKPHKKHINLLKKYKKQGFTVIVWSAGGGLWADHVVKRLGLDDVVDFTMSKGVKYLDDLLAKDILGTRVYLRFEDIPLSQKNIPSGADE